MDSIPDFVRDPVLAFADFALQNLGPIILAAIGVLLVMGSAALSSSIAERRGRGPLLHFIAGMLLPVIYPVLALAAVRPPPPRHRPDTDVEEEFAADALTAPPPPAAIAMKEDGAGKQGAPPSAQATVMVTGERFDHLYFKRIARDENGNVRGPFAFTIDGQSLRAERIVDVQQKLVVIETVDTAGRAQNLRVPYARIDECRVL